jgi:serine/threonine protein kinase
VWLGEDVLEKKNKFAFKEMKRNVNSDGELELNFAKNFIGQNFEEIVKIYDCFLEDEKYYIMMEYCEKSFSELLKEKRNGGLLNESV